MVDWRVIELDLAASGRLRKPNDFSGISCTQGFNERGHLLVWQGGTCRVPDAERRT